MRRNIRVTLGAATIVAALGLSGCSHPEFKRSSPPAPSLPPVTSSPLEAAPITPLPAPEALIDVLSRLADPAVPGTNKVQLIEGATPENAAALDRFTTALRDGSYLPMTFAANDIAWSDNKPSDVMATVVVTTAHPDNREFTFPMEFVSFKGGWQLSRQTAEMLLPWVTHRIRLRRLPARRRPHHRLPLAELPMWIGWLEFDVLLGDVRSLKQKRSVTRPLVAELQRKFSVSAAETGSHDLYRRAGIGVAVVSGDRSHAVDVLDNAERLVAAHPEFELLSVRRGLHRTDD